jgi:hypothetical protein
MGVVVVEKPKGSGNWALRIQWMVASGKPFRLTKKIGSGEEAREAAVYTHFVPKEKRQIGTALDRSRATRGQLGNNGNWADVAIKL